MEMTIAKNVPLKIYKDIVKIDFNESKKAAMVLRAINHKLRQNLLKMIEENGKMTVTEIYVKMRIEQSVASQQLSILRRARVVETFREGKFVYYTVNYKRFEEINTFINNLLY